MFLVTINIIKDPDKYFNRIVPRIESLTRGGDGMFLSQIILTTDNKVITPEEAKKTANDILMRIVVAYFEDNQKFSKYWNSDERRQILEDAADSAKFCDIPMLNDHDAGSVYPLTLALSGRAELLCEENLTRRMSKLGLTKRESEILYWIAQGKENADIAEILSLSIWTVKRHIANIFDKLGVTSRTAAVVLTMGSGVDQDA